jgi:hypothetical protein
MPSRCTHWQAPFEDLLKTVRGSGSHGQLLDIRDALRPKLRPDRPLVMLCPHAECNVLGAEAVCWDLDAYRNLGYQPSPADIDKIVEWFVARKPGALIVPPATDAHLAHRMTRALAAVGLVGAGLNDTLVLTGWTPWGPLPRPNAYFTYEGEAERTKEWAIHCHASQVLLTDYTEFCSHLGRAYAALAREWSEGHSLAGRAHRSDDRFVGVELFQVETYDPSHSETNPTDPIQIALGLLQNCPAPAHAVV